MFTVLAVTQSASAWFHFEPILGYNIGQWEDDKVQGAGLGLRVGFNTDHMFIAADGAQATLVMEDFPDANLSEAGLTIGAKLRGFRVWYGAILRGIFTYSDEPMEATATGRGHKIGIGGELSEKLNLNLEVKVVDYNELETPTQTGIEVKQLSTAGFVSFSWVF